MIWGITLQPGEPYTELVMDEIRLSMASLEFRSSKTTVPCPTSHVVLTTLKGEYLLCSLEKGSTPQQNLDLVLQPKEEITFSIEGTGVVHLTGYTPEGPPEFIEGSPEDEMIYIEEQGSDEPDHGPTAQARNNIKGEEEATTNEIIFQGDVSQRQNSNQDSVNSHAEITVNAVKTEPLDNGSCEGLYEGWIPEENHLMTQPSDISQDDGNLDNEEQVSLNKPNDISIQLQPTPINPSRKRTRSSKLVNQAKGVLKKLKQMPFQCSYCFKEFSSDVACSLHLESHTGTEGSSGNNDVSYSDAEDLAIGTVDDDDTDEAEERQSKKSMCTVGRPYSCKICKTSFTLLTSFIAHGRLHSVENAVKTPTYQIKVEHSRNVNVESNSADHNRKRSKLATGSSGNCGRLHLCYYCRKPFSSNSKKVLHERKHTGEKPYKCKHCLRGFAAVGDCRRHEQLHTEEGMLSLPRCRYCSKPFYSISKCLIHERIHTGEKPFKCGLCDKGFSQKGHLKTHERTHTGERPYQCQHCDRGFSTGSGRKKHERLHSGKKIKKIAD